jgi:hypothetical protein
MNCCHSHQTKDPGFANRKLECYREIQNPHSIIISSLVNATDKLAKNHVRVTSSKHNYRDRRPTNKTCCNREYEEDGIQKKLAADNL